MKTPAEFFAAFQRAGFLSACTWTPQPGGTPTDAFVRFRRSSSDVLGDAGAISFEPTAKWPLSQFVGAKRGDRLDITHDGSTTSYRIKELHRPGSGAQVLADLGLWT